MGKDKVTLQELAAISAEKTGLTKQIAEKFYKGLFAIVEEVLISGDTLKINGLGTFKTKIVEPRRIINISTGKEMNIEGYTKVVFIPEKSLKEFVNQPFAHLLPVDIEDVNETFVNFENNESVDNTENNNFKNEVIIEPLKVLEEQAIEIKNILDEINELSPKPSNTDNLKSTQQEDLQEKQTPLTEEKYSPFINNIKTDYLENKEIKEPPNSYYYRGKSTRNDNRKKIIWWKILLPLLVILLLMIVYIFVPQVNTKINKVHGVIIKNKIQVDTIRARDLLIKNHNDSIKSDSILITQDSVVIALPKADSISSSKPTPKTEQKLTPQTPDYNNIKATEIVTRGTTLAILARKYYGHPDFWVYIYQSNKTTIKNPASLEIGSKITIPQLDKSVIDLQNPQSLEKARQMGKNIIK
ncbi:MAG: HU family DNA-binding protein [Paludibacter sp.]|nr:HU family DNA-binding protein [Paludibacter sp.]